MYYDIATRNNRELKQKSEFLANLSVIIFD